MPSQTSEADKPIAGVWWIATEPERRVPGVLERTSAGHGELRLEDVLVKPPEDDRRGIGHGPIPLILGDTRSRSRVSLINCYESSRQNAEGWAPGPKSQSFAVQHSLVSHVLDADVDPATLEQPDPLIYGVWARLDVLDQWGDRGKFVSEGDLQQHDDGSYSTTWRLRWPADLRSDTRIGSITLTTPPTPSGAWHNQRLDVSRHCYLDCRLDPAIPLSELHERVLTPLRSFFAIATDSQSSYTQLNLSLAPTGSIVTELWCIPGPLDADGNVRVHTEEEANDAVRRGFFTVRHIEGKFDRVVARWFELFERIETPVSSILAAADYGSGRFTSDHFQSAAFAAEALHRSLGLVVDSVPAEQGEDIARRMVEALTPAEQLIDWLRSRAQTVAAPRYEDRLAQLVQQAPLALQQAAGDDFAKRVKRARHYFAHLDNRTLRRPNPNELHRVTSLLVLVMVSQLLREVGLDDIEARIRYADRFWELQRRGAVIVRKSDDGRETFYAQPPDGR